MAKRRLGVLTGGGDVPGLNSVIKGVVYRAGEIDAEVIGIRRGWEGLTHSRVIDGRDARYIMPLDRQNTRTIDRTGGTILHTSRTKPSGMKVSGLPEWLQKEAGRFKEVRPGVVDVTPRVLENLQALKLDTLVAIGGDDTLSYAAELHRSGFHVVAVPKTMDNDVRNTEYCIGFSTAITRAEAAITRLRTTIGSHERIGIFRIFGRDAGFTALYTAYVTSVRCCIPEQPFELEKLIDVLVKDKEESPSRYSLVILSEGAMWRGGKLEEYGEADAYGHRKKENVGDKLAGEIQGRRKGEAVAMDLTYDLRSGAPDFLDKMVATTFANMAMDCVADGEFGRMMAIQEGCYQAAEIPDPKLGPRKVDVAAMYNVERFRPNYAGKRGLPIFLNPQA